MHFKCTICILASFIAFSTQTSNAQGFGVVVDSAEAKQNELICIPVRAKGFDQISSFQYSLTWNPAVLKFDHTQNYNLPGWTSQSFFENTPGTLLLGWDDPTGLATTRVDGTLLYEVCFLAVGPINSSTKITPGSSGFPPGNGSAEAFSGTMNVWNSALIEPGYVLINGVLGTENQDQTGKLAFQLIPNPTQSGALVSLISDSSAPGNLSVIDMQGRVVYREQVFINPGENVFKIPENTLKIKDLYQVSLQTEHGISTQILVVN